MASLKFWGPTQQVQRASSKTLAQAIHTEEEEG